MPSSTAGVAPSLLGSYETERRPVGLRNVAEASRNLERMLLTREGSTRARIVQRRPCQRCRAQGLGDWFAAIMRHEWFANGVMLGYRYEKSPIVSPDGTPAPADESRPLHPDVTARARARRTWLADGRSTLDLFGRGLPCCGLATMHLMQARSNGRRTTRRSAAKRCRERPAGACRLSAPSHPGAPRRPCRLARRCTLPSTPKS